MTEPKFTNEDGTPIEIKHVIDNGPSKTYMLKGVLTGADETILYITYPDEENVCSNASVCSIKKLAENEELISFGPEEVQSLASTPNVEEEK